MSTRPSSRFHAASSFMLTTWSGRNSRTDPTGAIGGLNSLTKALDAIKLDWVLLTLPLGASKFAFHIGHASTTSPALA